MLTRDEQVFLSIWTGMMAAGNGMARDLFGEAERGLEMFNERFPARKEEEKPKTAKPKAAPNKEK